MSFKPKELEPLEKALAELHGYKSALSSATFPGREIKNANKLMNFIQDSYDQLIKKIQEHPFYASPKSEKEVNPSAPSDDSAGG